MQQTLNNFQRQVLELQMIVCDFCTKLSDMVKEWVTILVAYMYLKPEIFPKASFGISFVSNVKYVLAGSLL